MLNINNSKWKVCGGKMVNDIIVSDALQNIKDEIQLLKMTLAELMQERDDLIYHVCPELL